MSKKTPPWVARKKAGPNRGKFTRALWDKWMAELNGVHPHAAQLREGINETRRRLVVPNDAKRVSHEPVSPGFFAKLRSGA